MAMFGRFLDSWVVDRVMFEYVNQGGCNCCGFTHGGMDMQDFMAMCSDVETDDGKKEVRSIWPPAMINEVWQDRVKFRRLLKDTMPKYRELNEKFGPDFVQWWLGLTPKERRRCFMMPKQEVNVQFNTTFDFKTAYQVVLCSVLEQVAQFEATGYVADGATECEIYLEEHLKLERGAWTVSPEYYETDEGCDNFLGMCLQLGGDHLLPKRPNELRKEAARAKAAVEDDVDDLGAGAADQKNVDDEEEEEGEGADTDAPQAGKGTQSFQSDRRLVRMIMFRYFADMAWARFKRFHATAAEQQPQPDKQPEAASKPSAPANDKEP
ncbi:Histone-lysine N-methyltransferase setd3, partial [Durusdinium trenchii]